LALLVERSASATAAVVEALERSLVALAALAISAVAVVVVDARHQPLRLLVPLVLVAQAATATSSSYQSKENQ
jgi:hypothetical protein